jgi:hypothetical protein
VAALAAVTPAAWFLVGVVNPNTWEVALAALGWVGVARLARGGERRPADAWWISVPMAAAVVARPVALVAAVTMLAVVEVMPGRRPNRRDRWALRAPVAAAVAAGAVWQRWAAVAVDDPRTAQQGSWWQAVTTAIGGLPRTAAELVASLGWLEYGVAPAVAAAWAAVLVAAVVTVRRTSGPAGFGRAVAVWAVALVGTPVVFEAVMFWRLGPIWQGRYSLGVWLGLIALVLVQPPRPAPSPRPARVPLALIAAGAVEVACVLVAAPCLEALLLANPFLDAGREAAKWRAVRPLLAPSSLTGTTLGAFAPARLAAGLPEGGSPTPGLRPEDAVTAQFLDLSVLVP